MQVGRLGVLGDGAHRGAEAGALEEPGEDRRRHGGGHEHGGLLVRDLDAEGPAALGEVDVHEHRHRRERGVGEDSTPLERNFSVMAMPIARSCRP
ncbi:hypothetical protein [Actinomarinicola tropica]|uniref:hypothetical protein n=1 Tax=Actinomarinicola tropica TaxID=2789776 RepID=UPI001E44E2FD|nr:hypothetical protein [Actinomarinicola tropica]